MPEFYFKVTKDNEMLFESEILKINDEPYQMGECEVASDCDDQNPCTQDVCDNNKCNNTPLEYGVNCSGCSGSSCICDDGECVIKPECEVASDCDDQNSCTQDVCKDYKCKNIVKDDFDSCSGCSGNSCICDDGECITSYIDWYEPKTEYKLTSSAVCVISGNGNLNCVRQNEGTDYDSLSLLETIDNVKDVVYADNYGCALLQGGTVKCIGEGVTSPETIDIKDVKQISLGGDNTYALLDGGRVMYWENNVLGDECRSLTKRERCNIGGYRYKSPTEHKYGLSKNQCLEFCEDEHLTGDGCCQWRELDNGDRELCGYYHEGEVMYENDPDSYASACLDPAAKIPSPVVGIYDAKYITAGGYEGEDYACAVLESGDLKCWGYNGDGQLGANTTLKGIPVIVQGIPNMDKVEAGVYHTCALSKNGEVYCWGQNRYGNLGDYELEDREIVLSPSKIVEYGYPESQAVPKNIVDISVNGGTTCILSLGGDLLCYGRLDGHSTDIEAMELSGQSRAVRINKDGKIFMYASHGHYSNRKSFKEISELYCGSNYEHEWKRDGLRCTCAEGYKNCNNDLGDGCETNIYSDDNNCGDCGRRCGLHSECRSGVWGHRAPTCLCTGDWSDCDTGNSRYANPGDENGCETNGACDYCESHAEKKCVDGDGDSEDELYWYDSCGNREEMIDDCKQRTGLACGSWGSRDANGNVIDREPKCCPIPQVAINGYCVPKAGSGEYCYADNQCEAGLTCSDHTCVHP